MPSVPPTSKSSRPDYGRLSCISPGQGEPISGRPLLPAPPPGAVAWQACVLYLLHVGVMEQMGEEAQRSLADALAKQLTSQDMSPHMMVASLRTLANLLATLGEVLPVPQAPLPHGCCIRPPCVPQAPLLPSCCICTSCVPPTWHKLFLVQAVSNFAP